MDNRWVWTLFALFLAPACGVDVDHSDRGDRLTVRQPLERESDVDFARINRITPDDASDGNQFGASIDVDERVLAVGAPRRKPGGAVYLFNLSGTQRRVVEGADGNGLGKVVRLDDGTLAALAVDDGPGGVVHLYRETDAGGMTHVAGLAPADVSGGDKWGAALDLDGGTLAVGAPGRGDGGEVWIYEADTAERDQWRQVAVLQSDHVVFGRSIALQGDRLAVAARDDTRSDGSGSVWVFERDSDDGTWNEAGVVNAPSETRRDEFGAALDLDGRRLAVGAAETEAIFVYEHRDDTWSLTDTIVPDEPTDAFATSVALGDGRLVAGTFLSEQHLWIYSEVNGEWRLDHVFGVEDEDPRPNYFATETAIAGDTVLAASPDPPIMRNGGVTGHLQGWVDVFRVNAAPQAESSPTSGPEDRLFALDVTVVEPDGEPVVVEIVRAPRHGEITGDAPNLNYRSDADYHGPDDARIAFVDPYGARAEVEIEVEVLPVNDAPRGEGHGVRVRAGEPTAIELPAFDPEGDPIEVITVRKPSNGVVSAEQLPIVYTSDPHYDGFDFLEYRLSDGMDESIVYELEIEVVDENAGSDEDPDGKGDGPDFESRGVPANGGCATAAPSGPTGLLATLFLLIAFRRIDP